MSPVFTLRLYKTYYNQGFFNVPRAFDHLVGNEGAATLVLRGSGSIKGHVNRTANLNRTTRVMGGVPLRSWFQRNYSEGDTVPVRFDTAFRLGSVDIQSKTCVMIGGPPAFGANYATATLNGTEASGDTVKELPATNATSYELAAEGDYALFSVDSSGTITVNTLGENEFGTLESGDVKLYTVRLVATNDDGQASIVVAVQVTKA